MAIVSTIRTATQFEREFQQISPATFSVAALETLFEFYEELSESIGEDMEIDPVAIRCDWGEYTDQELWDEFASHYNAQLLGQLANQGPVELAEKMEDDTTVLPVKQPVERDTWLVSQF